MKRDRSFAAGALRQVSDLMDYELLVSRPGIKDKDTNFIWAASFRAPIGVSFTGKNVFFNLFLPEGADKDPEKKLFLNRVGAKFEDDLWQVRRSMDEVTGTYGPALKVVVSNFKSVMLDYTYILKGRFYAHFVFNEADLANVSNALLSLSNKVDGLRVEYLMGAAGEVRIFNAIEENEEASAVTLQAYPDGKEMKWPNDKGNTFFALGNVPEKGVKLVARTDAAKIPKVLEPVEAAQMDGGIVAFHSSNMFLLKLLELIAANYIVVHGFYGSANEDTVTLSVIVPTQQTSALLKVLREMMEEGDSLNFGILEIVDLKELL